MEKRWVFVLGIVIVMIIASISLFSITETTGSFVYGKCWKTSDLSEDQDISLKVQGCIVEEDRACCPFENCPSGIDC